MFSLAISTEVTAIGVPHLVMAHPLKWEFKRLERVQRKLRKINELETCLESLIYLDHQKPAMGEMFTDYVLGEQIKINSNLGFLFFFFFPYVSSKSKECLLFLQCNRKDSGKNRYGIFNNRSTQSL